LDASRGFLPSYRSYRHTPRTTCPIRPSTIHRRDNHRPTSMNDDRSPLLAGTLDLLVLKTLSVASLHGYGIAQHLKRLSRDALRIEEGSLYPALQRMQVKGWISSELKQSPTGRKARYYKLTAAGRRQLEEEQSEFERSVAVTR